VWCSFLWFSLPIQLKYTTIWCIFCRNLCFRGFLITFGQFVQVGIVRITNSWWHKYSVQRLLEFKMVAHGYRYNCYYNHCFLLSLLWGTGVFDHYRAIYNIRSIRIWFYWVARTKHPSIWVLAKVPLVTKAFNIKNDVDFHSWICPFYCIGWVQNLETQTYLALVARDRKRHSVIEKIYKSRNTRPLRVQTKG
jgi:hypothetical protein